MLLNGKDFNTAIKQLVDPSAGFGTLDNTITKITFRKGSTDKGNIVSSSESPRTARATYNTETREITIYVDANKLIFPESCLCMFYFFGSVTQIDWSEFGTNIDTHNVTDMSKILWDIL